jgi:hypothetical protein
VSDGQKKWVGHFPRADQPALGLITPPNLSYENHYILNKENLTYELFKPFTSYYNLMAPLRLCFFAFFASKVHFFFVFFIFFRKKKTKKPFFYFFTLKT